MLASVIGVVLWLTSMPVTGEILMVIRALLVVADVLLGAVWSRGSGKAGIAC